MSKATRFWLTMGSAALLVTLLQPYVKEHLPALDKALLVVGFVAVMVCTLRYLYEHWDDV